MISSRFSSYTNICHISQTMRCINILEGKCRVIILESHFQLQCAKHHFFLPATTNFWNWKIHFLLCWHLFCYSSSNTHAYSMLFYGFLTPKSSPIFLLQKWSLCRHRNSTVSVACYPILQPCFQVRPFCNMYMLFFSKFCNSSSVFPIHMPCLQLQVDIIYSSCPVTMLFHTHYHFQYDTSNTKLYAYYTFHYGNSFIFNQPTITATCYWM
jgi:hypothetical protein